VPVDRLEAKNTFQNRTLRAIRVVAEKAPPDEARRAPRAIDVLAKEALDDEPVRQAYVVVGVHHDVAQRLSKQRSGRPWPMTRSRRRSSGTSTRGTSRAAVSP
jgi:hypothetical protein